MKVDGLCALKDTSSARIKTSERSRQDAQLQHFSQLPELAEQSLGVV